MAQNLIKMQNKKKTEYVLILFITALFALASFISISLADLQLKKTLDSCAKIDLGGDYILTKDITDIEFEKFIGGCFVFNAQNIKLDCLGHKISSSSPQTVAITINENNASVKNCFISMNNGTGIALLQSSNANIENNSMLNNRYAIFLYDSSNNRIENNSFDKNQHPITLTTSSDNNIIINDKINESLTYALLTFGSSNNLFSDLEISNTRGDVLIFGASSNNNILRDVSITNTDSQHFDIKFTDSGNNNTLIDSYFGRYDLNEGNILNFIISRFGEINFLQPIFGIGRNLSEDIMILNNSLIIMENQSGLNKSASLTFFNISKNLFNYTILRNNQPCPKNICSNETTLNAGTVRIKVNGSGNYSISWSQIGPPAPEPFCIDSDSGLNYEIKGNVSYLSKITQSSASIQNPGNIELINYRVSASFDYCIDDIILTEYFCFVNETISFPSLTRYSCPYGCANSACLLNQSSKLELPLNSPNDKTTKEREFDSVRFIQSSPRYLPQNISFVEQEEYYSKEKESPMTIKKTGEFLNLSLTLLIVFNIIALVLVLFLVFSENQKHRKIINKEK